MLEAIANARTSLRPTTTTETSLRDVLGADQHEIWLQQAERELAFFNQQVTPFETARYLGTF